MVQRSQMAHGYRPQENARLMQQQERAHIQYQKTFT